MISKLENNNCKFNSIAIIVISVVVSTQLQWLAKFGFTGRGGETVLRIIAAVAVGYLTYMSLVLLSKKAVLVDKFLLTNMPSIRVAVLLSIILISSSVFYPNQLHVTLVFSIAFMICCDRSQGIAADKSKFLNNWILLLLSILVVISRDVSLFVSPRIWAEDGTFFLQHYYSNQNIAELFRPFEYFRVIHNTVTYFGLRIVPLKHIPHLFTYVALAIQLLPILIVLKGRSILWDSQIKKMIVIAIILFAPSSEEIWLNLNGTSYYLSVATVVILLSSCNKPKDAVIYRTILLMSGLSGLLSCLLTPLFYIKAIIQKNSESKIQFILLLSIVVVQLASLAYATFISESNPDRSNPPDFYILGFIVWIKTFALNTSVELAEYYSQYFSGLVNLEIHKSDSLLYWAIILLILSGYMLIKRAEIFYLVAAFLLLTLFSSYFGIAGYMNMAFFDVSNGNRYFYAPNVLLSLLLVSPLLLFVDSKKRTLLPYLGMLFFVFILHNGINRFYDVKTSFDNWPDWNTQITKWEANPDHPIEIWPPPFTIKLIKKDL